MVASYFSRAQISVKLQSRLGPGARGIEPPTPRPGAVRRPGIRCCRRRAGCSHAGSHGMSPLSSSARPSSRCSGCLQRPSSSVRHPDHRPDLLPVSPCGVMGYLGSREHCPGQVSSVALGLSTTTRSFHHRYRREVAAGASTERRDLDATTHGGGVLTTANNSCGLRAVLSEYRPGPVVRRLCVTMVGGFPRQLLILPATIKLMPRVFGADSLGAAGSVLRQWRLCWRSRLPAAGRPNVVAPGCHGRATAERPRDSWRCAPALRPNRRRSSRPVFA